MTLRLGGVWMVSRSAEVSRRALWAKLLSSLLVIGFLTGLAACSSPEPESTARGERTSAQGAWLGGTFTAIVQDLPSVEQPGDVIWVRVRLDGATVLGSDVVTLAIQQEALVCQDTGQPASLEELVPGTAVSFTSRPNPAGIAPLMPPLVPGDEVHVPCA